jgi:DNA-directed RNA polymerase omega subunit
MERAPGPATAGSENEDRTEEAPVKVITPNEVAKQTGSKYLGVLVAAKYARELNALPRDLKPLGQEKKLTTRALEALTSGQIEFRLVGRRRREE